MSKLNYYQKKNAPSPLEQVENEKERQNILKAVRATEMHMILSGIAMGILQILSVTSMGILTLGQLRYQRAPSRGTVSEGARWYTYVKFFVYGKTAGIMYNSNNSEATGYVRNLLGFSGFLVVQTFYS